MFDVPEVLLSQVVPSEEVRMVPGPPTVINNPVEVVVCTIITTFTTGNDGETKKKGENDEYMSHLVSYKWFRRTLRIP